MELRGWALSYAFFIALTTRPVPSITRYLLLTIVPWWPVPEVAARARGVQALALVLAVLLGLLLHTWWIAVYVRASVTGPSMYFP